MKIAKKPEELYLATHIILPGVGAFADGINNLKVGKWDKVLDEIVKEKKIPILGICLGMQLFATYGYESGEVEGLNSNFFRKYHLLLTLVLQFSLYYQ